MLTLVMATHNGGETLADTLEAFAQVTPPEGGWKLVVVDNASTDDTSIIIGKYAESLPLVRVSEPRLGKSNALNTGLNHVSGDLIVFVDDDIIMCPDFLIQWRRFADDHPEFAVIGGAITPHFAVSPPNWVLNKDWMTLLYTATVPGRHACEMRLGEPLDAYGPNMAIRREIVEKGFRFDARFMVGPTALMGEDTEFVALLARSGYRVGFAPKAEVRHMIQARQVTWRWILKRFYRHGRSRYFIEAPRQPSQARQIIGIPRYLIHRSAQKALSVPIAAASLQPEKIMIALREVAYDLGAITEARRMYWESHGG